LQPFFWQAAVSHLTVTRKPDSGFCDTYCRPAVVARFGANLAVGQASRRAPSFTNAANEGEFIAQNPAVGATTKYTK
jgi:hypothetical protein